MSNSSTGQKKGEISKHNVFFRTLQGKRDSNEDAHILFFNSNSEKKDFANVNVVGIFDGHGGSEVSNFLSEELLKHVCNNKIKHPWSKKQIVAACDNLQQEVKKKNYSYNVGSTALVLSFIGDYFVNIMNVGDSRAVMCGDRNIAIPLTKDHSPGTFSEKKRIESLGGKIEQEQGDVPRIKNLSVSRAFGDFDTFPFVTHRPDLFKYSFHGSKFIVAGCDGLWEKLTNEDVVEYILDNCYEIQNKKQVRKKTNFNIADKLAHHAINSGSMDNISVYVIFLE